METKESASAIFDTFVEICKKHKINFVIADSEDTAIKEAKNDIDTEISVTSTVVRVNRGSRPTAPNKVTEFVTWFCKTPGNYLYSLKRGQWECKLDNGVWVLVFNSDGPQRIPKADVEAGRILAFRPIGQNDLTMVNGGRFLHMGSHAWRASPWQELAIQALAMPVPLRVIMANPPNGLGKRLDDISIIDWSGAEKLIVRNNRATSYYGSPYLEERHFAGTAVIKIGEDHFLLDADRQELTYYLFNAFFTKLPGPVKTIKEAYDSLIPSELKDGSRYLRQGELFFEPTDDSYIRSKMKRLVPNEYMPIFNNIYMHMMWLAKQVADDTYCSHQQTNNQNVTAAGGHDPIMDKNPKIVASLRALYKYDNISGDHTDTNSKLTILVSPVGFAGTYQVGFSKVIALPSATAISGVGRHTSTLLFAPYANEIYVYGTVVHSQHHILKLNQWHRVYKSPAAGSWNITGEVD